MNETTFLIEIVCYACNWLAFSFSLQYSAHAKTAIINKSAFCRYKKKREQKKRLTIAFELCAFVCIKDQDQL